MSHTVRPVDYFHATVYDRAGEAYKVLTSLAAAGVNLLAFSASPVGATASHMVLFPEDTSALVAYAGRSGMVLSGPERALMVQGDDELGALAQVHRSLADARVNVFASNAVTGGEGRFGYVIHVRAEDFDAAARALGL
jgi:hypothetical protein